MASGKRPLMMRESGMMKAMILMYEKKATRYSWSKSFRLNEVDLHLAGLHLVLLHLLSLHRVHLLDAGIHVGPLLDISHHDFLGLELDHNNAFVLGSIPEEGQSLDGSGKKFCHRQKFLSEKKTSATEASL